MKRIYFLRPVGQLGPVKIGCSVSPDGLRESLATWSPFTLEIIAEIDGDFTVERQFHALFRDTYQRREWFGWSDLMAETVNAINAGTFDLASLPDPQQLGRFGVCRRPWTADQRLRASYTHRVFHAERRSGKRFDIHFTHCKYADCWQQFIPQIEAFLAQHGQPRKAAA